jgi:hypothetical protein
VAHGIRYLHHDCNPMVVHKDIKPRNILLDGQMEAKVHGYIAPVQHNFDYFNGPQIF